MMNHSLSEWINGAVQVGLALWVLLALSVAGAVVYGLKRRSKKTAGSPADATMGESSVAASADQASSAAGSTARPIQR